MLVSGQFYRLLGACQVPERQESTPSRTYRPSVHSSLPTVAEVLDLDVVAAGDPEILVGDDALTARVRWVHVSDTTSTARLLEGGELLLSTGGGWPDSESDMAAFITELSRAGLAGLVLELGTRFSRVPQVVIDTARAHELALIALHREVRFVAVTEAVHRRIISEQLDALRARDDVRALFTSLALRGTPADYIVQQLSLTLGTGVVLENLAHDVVFASVSDPRLLAGWQRRSREHLQVPVEARGTRWGHVVAFEGPSHPAGRVAVLEQGAIALALGRLADPDGAEWAHLRGARLLDDLTTQRFRTAASATTRVEAAGLPIAGRTLIGLWASGAAPIDLDAWARGIGARALVADSRVLLSLPRGGEIGDAAARALLADTGATSLVIGPSAAELPDALSSLREAEDLSRTPGPAIRRTHDHPLAHLVAQLGDDHRLQAHGERMLTPLVTHGGDLLQVLAAFLAHPANRTAAATASHLSRSVFYQRLTLIQDLLGVDLDDGETQTALHLALLTRR
ncbi:MAG: PucR family transcriptional regulator [Microbacterium sp.]